MVQMHYHLRWATLTLSVCRNSVNVPVTSKGPAR